MDELLKDLEEIDGTLRWIEDSDCSASLESVLAGLSGIVRRLAERVIELEKKHES